MHYLVQAILQTQGSTMKSLIVLMLLVSPFAKAATAASSLPSDGTYQAFGKNSECDINLESDRNGRAIYLSYISNQRTGEYCWNQATEIYTCDSASTCTAKGEDHKTITLIHERSFILGQDEKYKFVNNEAVLPARKVTSFAVHGIPFRQWSSPSAGMPYCYFISADGKASIRCDDQNYAKKMFCPEAEKTAINSALSKCKDETGKTCQWQYKTASTVKSTLRFMDCADRNINDTCTFYYELTCRADVTATPIK